MNNAAIFDFSKWKDAREQISESRKFENYLVQLPLHELMNESSSLISQLSDGDLDEKLMRRCKIVLKEIDKRMGGQPSDLNRAFNRLYKQATQRIGELNHYLEV